MLLRVVLVLGAVLALALKLHAQVIVIRNVNVVDVVSGRILRERFVQLSGTSIDRIEDKTGPVPRGAMVIDGTHKYLIPGLWDMHVHLWYSQNLFPPWPP